MSVVKLTLQQVLIQALKRAGVATAGQPISGEDLNDALTEFHLMLAEWSVDKVNVPFLIERSFVSLGYGSYTIGPNGTIDVVERPARIYSCFVRQLTNPGTPSGPGLLGDSDQLDSSTDLSQAGDPSTLTPQGQYNPTDYLLELIDAKENWDRISNKFTVSLPSYCFYDGAWPKGRLLFWPIPQASIYEIHVSFADYIDQTTNLASVLALPSVAYAAVIWNLTVRLAEAFQMPPSPPAMARASAAKRAMQRANHRSVNMRMPVNLVRPGIYNPYSDLVR